MILADTTIWVDHFRSGEERLQKLLIDRQILLHPYVLGELALGSLPSRQVTLAYLRFLPQVPVASFEEVHHLIESRALFSRGIGWTDVHLLASVLFDRRLALWTRDKRLRNAAEDLGILANIL